MTERDRCSVFRARVEALEQDLADPALAALLADGASVVSTLVIEDRGESFLLLLLSPPARRVSPDARVVATALGALSVVLLADLLLGIL